MATIDANISFSLPDGVDYTQYIDLIKNQLSNLTGTDTKITLQEVDDPLSTSPIWLNKAGLK